GRRKKEEGRRKRGKIGKRGRRGRRGKQGKIGKKEELINHKGTETQREKNEEENFPILLILPIPHYLLPITYYPLPITHYPINFYQWK
ncbi:MAG: O-antigen ligase family protein, partial [Microcoleaceae cyanobacterium]